MGWKKFESRVEVCLVGVVGREIWVCVGYFLVEIRNNWVPLSVVVELISVESCALMEQVLGISSMDCEFSNLVLIQEFGTNYLRFGFFEKKSIKNFVELKYYIFKMRWCLPIQEKPIFKGEGGQVLKYDKRPLHTAVSLLPSSVPGLGSTKNALSFPCSSERKNFPLSTKDKRFQSSKENAPSLCVCARRFKRNDVQWWKDGLAVRWWMNSEFGLNLHGKTKWVRKTKRGEFAGETLPLH